MKTGNGTDLTKILRRTAALILAALMLLPAAACSEKPGQTDEQDAQDSPVSVSGTPADVETDAPETRQPNALPEKDWGGKTFRVIGQTNPTYSQFSNHEIDAEELTGDALNDAIFNRNLTIENRYNTLIEGDVSSQTAHDRLHQTVMAGDDTFHLAFCVSESIGSVVLRGDFQNIQDLDYVDYSKPWWNPEVNEQVSVAHRLYFTTSDFALSDKQRVNVLMYNKDLLADMGLEDPIPLVREGTWTVDVMTDWVEKTGQDVDGDGAMTDADRYGLTMDSYTAFKVFAFALGARIVAKDADDLPVLVMNSENMINVIDKTIALTCTPLGTLFCDEFSGKVDYDFWSVSSNVFKAGRGLFINGFTHSLSSLSDSDINYNVIPYPKFNEAQKDYYTLADKFAMLFGLPMTCKERDFAGFMLEALAWESTDTTLYTYYDISCKRKYMYDETGPEMLDITFSGIVYDPALIYSWGGLNMILADTIPKKRENVFASHYAREEKVAKKNIEKTLKKFEELG